MGENLWLISRVVKHINKKTEYNLYYLVYFFIEIISLRVINCIIKELDFKFIK